MLSHSCSCFQNSDEVCVNCQLLWWLWCVDAVNETESSTLEFCIVPFGMLVIALTHRLQPQVSVLSARMNASCAAFSTACVSWMIRSNSD